MQRIISDTKVAGLLRSIRADSDLNPQWRGQWILTVQVFVEQMFPEAFARLEANDGKLVAVGVSPDAVPSEAQKFLDACQG